MRNVKHASPYYKATVPTDRDAMPKIMKVLKRKERAVTSARYHYCPSGTASVSTLQTNDACTAK